MRTPRLALALVTSLAMAAGLGAVAPPEALAARYRVAYRNHRHRLSPRENKRMNQYIRQGCYVFQLSRTQYDFFLRALGHTFDTFNDPRFQRLLRQQRFTFTNLAGPAVVRRVTSTSLRLTVWGYQRRRPSCRVGRHANAFHIYDMIYLNKDYLEARRLAGDWRRLARTLAHELLHNLGFGHGGNRGQRALAKRRSVPIAVGCLVGHWPDVAEARRRCLR